MNTVYEMQKQQCTDLLDSLAITYSEVGNGDLLILSPSNRAYYFTIATNKWRAKGKTKAYSSRNLQHFIDNYLNKP